MEEMSGLFTLYGVVQSCMKSMEARYRYGEIMQEVWYSQGMELVEALIDCLNAEALSRGN